MTDSDGILEIRVTHSPNVPSVMKVFRKHTSHSLAEIRNAINEQTPLVVARLYRTDHDEAEQRSLALLNELDAMSVRFEIILDGAVESLEYLQNVLVRWRDIVLQTEMMSDLESGEPCVETLQQLKRESSTDAYRQTLQQILNRDGYNVDSETLQWVQREFKD